MMRNTLDLNPKFFSCRHIFLGRTHPLQIAASLLYWMMVKISCDRAQYLRPLVGNFHFVGKTNKQLSLWKRQFQYEYLGPILR